MYANTMTSSCFCCSFIVVVVKESKVC